MRGTYDDTALMLTIGALMGAWNFHLNTWIGLGLLLVGFWVPSLWKRLPWLGGEDEGSVSSRGKR